MQWHFDFKDWEQAFELYYRRKAQDETLALIVSTDSYSSGYWIEPMSGAEPDDVTKVYHTVEAVKQLEQRVRDKREATVNLSLGGVVT
jgi:hypothetical protein